MVLGPLSVRARTHIHKIWENADLDGLKKGEAMTPVGVARIVHDPALVTQRLPFKLRV